MSYNVTGTEILCGSLRISAEDLLRLRQQKDKLPESNFVEIMARRYELLDEKPSDMPIPHFWWSGSGSCDGTFLLHVASYLGGKADIVFIWEGGDSLTGLRIADGIAIRCRVVKTLVPE